MNDSILTAPKNTNELMNFVTFIANTKANILPELGRLGSDLLTCQFFLLDFIPLTESVLVKNITETSQWAKNIYEVITKSTEIVIQRKKREFKNLLLERRNTLNEDLVKLRTEVEEFQTFGDINEIEMYVEKSKSIDDRLTVALEAITQFNKEEIFFDMSESVYPLRKTVSISAAHPYCS